MSLTGQPSSGIHGSAACSCPRPMARRYYVRTPRVARRGCGSRPTTAGGRAGGRVPLRARYSLHTSLHVQNLNPGQDTCGKWSAECGLRGHVAVCFTPCHFCNRSQRAPPRVWRRGRRRARPKRYCASTAAGVAVAAGAAAAAKCRALLFCSGSDWLRL